MHWTYQAPDTRELYQGDVLERTPELNAILAEVHPHFFQKEKNLFFMVLTQSCDLVLRGADGGCRAPYISIAPIRTVDSVVSKEVGKLSLPIAAEVPVLTDKSKTKLSEFLQRLYNNNEPGYFFLEPADTPLPEDCCTYLTLSVPIKAAEHYTKLIAKRLELDSALTQSLV
jgi:hypothetical protein